ncbi:hypothetical protein C0J52_06817 [Blattella germanica]|nr:hypothetical protein C0J52_06817 [Blattella germanica]
MGLLGKLFPVGLTLTAVTIGYLNYKMNEIPEIPELKSTWWGTGDPRKVDESIRKNHLPLTPPMETVNFEYGFNSNYLKEVVEYWKTKYNWRERESFLNSFPQFKTIVDGLDLHFIHVKPQKVDKNTRVLPLLLLHGWPGSVREFYELIPLLTTPQKNVDFVFEVIAPSLPGYGFSEGASKPGLGAAQMAVVMKDLMERLGFKKFYAQGGDWGSAIVHNIAILFPGSLYGMHSNICDKNWRSENDGGLTRKYKLADLLDNVMIYWVTGSITTSVRLYSETFNKNQFGLQLESDMPRGGHFAAFEEPDLLSKEIWETVKIIENKKITV